MRTPIQSRGSVRSATCRVHSWGDGPQAHTLSKRKWPSASHVKLCSNWARTPASGIASHSKVSPRARGATSLAAARSRARPRGAPACLPTSLAAVDTKVEVRDDRVAKLVSCTSGSSGSRRGCTNIARNGYFAESCTSSIFVAPKPAPRQHRYSPSPQGYPGTPSANGK